MLKAIRSDERGQTLIIVVISMALFVLLAALAIDIASWYQKHHRAQVAADAAALAAATCMGNSKSGATCTDNSDTTHATSVATSYASTNGLPTPTTQVNVDTTDNNVTVTTQAPAPLSFAGINFAHTISATAVASWDVNNVPISIFTGNQSCNPGTGLQILSNGGGRATVDGLYADGVISNNDNSGSAHFGGTQYSIGNSPHCSSSYNPKNTNVAPGPDIAYPVQYSEPSVTGATITTNAQWNALTSGPTITPGVCTFAATYFSTDAPNGINKIQWPGIYCVVTSAGSMVLASSYSATTDCADGVNLSGGGGKTTNADDQPGSIYVGTAVTGQYEFVGPCVVGAGGLTSTETQVTGEPLVYATNQVDTSNTCLDPTTTPPNLVRTTEVVNSPDGVFLDSNNLTLNAPLYDPCGTVQLAFNNNFAAFIEAANVTIDKNNFGSFKGTGPAIGGGGVTLVQ
jgi:Flp pilus assembly protein TadG